MFHPAHVVDVLRRDTPLRDHAVEVAAPWRALSCEQLWDWVFSHRLPRSWMVWSDGTCPACGDDVTMYDWRIEPFAHPWKLACPHCDQRFPTNDAAAFHRSGLDETGLFDPERADRSLLVNEEHPDPDDPLHTFGVDDGHGFVDDENRRWRFVATWLVYGQWKGLICKGIDALSEAFLLTGDVEYSRRAGVLLDRLSDAYPDYDYSTQGYVYEKAGNRGYLSNWHDACAEILVLTVAYDRVREALRDDADLTTFLQERARRFDLPTPKGSGAQICANIESRILQHTVDHVDRIQSNFPTTEMALVLIEAVLRGPDGMDSVHERLDDAIARSTAVDGLSGEKGLSGYARIAPRTLATYLALFARGVPGFLDDVLRRHPALHDHYRFHLDTWVGRRFHPNVGDCGCWTKTTPTYGGVDFARPDEPTVAPSMFTFFWQLYEATGDVAFVQILHDANGGDVDGLPHDPFCADPAAFQRQVAAVIEQHGDWPDLPSVNKENWHLAILRGGADDGPVPWLDYDSGAMNSVYAYRLDPSVRGRGAHSHADGLNLGLFYRGVDLIPDLGYPPVNFGGWNSPEAEWYKMSAAHNTVVVDGLDLANAGGTTTWWQPSGPVRGLSVSAPGLIEGEICERTVVVVDIDDRGRDAYLVDVLRLLGGSDHARFLLGPFGPLCVGGLSLSAGADYGHATLLRAFREDDSPAEGWQADWRLDDRAGLAPTGSELHLRYTDLSRGCSAGTCESWACYGPYTDRDVVWLERPWLRRRGPAPLASVFAGVLEPYDGTPAVTAVQRLDEGDGSDARQSVHLAIDVAGRRDEIVVDAEGAVQVTTGR